MCRLRCFRLHCLVIGRLGPHGLMRGLATSWVDFSYSCLTPCLKLTGMPRGMILSLSSVASFQRILYFLEAWPVKIKIKETVEVVLLLKFWSASGFEPSQPRIVVMRDHSGSCVLLAVQGPLVRDHSGSCVLLAPHISVRSQRLFCFWLCFLEHWLSRPFALGHRVFDPGGRLVHRSCSRSCSRMDLIRERARSLCPYLQVC